MTRTEELLVYSTLLAVLSKSLLNMLFFGVPFDFSRIVVDFVLICIYKQNVAILRILDNERVTWMQEKCLLLQKTF